MICICNSSPQKVLRGLLISGQPYYKTLGIISLKFQSELNVYVVNHIITQMLPEQFGSPCVMQEINISKAE